VLSQAILALIAFGPAVLVMRLRREPWASAGVSDQNLGRSLAVGVVLSVVTVAGAFLGDERRFGRVIAGLAVSHFWALLKYALVGFGEEFVFRGYLQTRLVAWLGRWQGWVVTSVLMALSHLVQRMAVVGMSPLDALVSSASLVPVSLLMGYVMLRTENVVAPGLFHTFADWVNMLG
jgi:membrane protease YdiL (CAAX protease family)